MGDQEQFVEQQFIASEAVVVLDKMLEGMVQLEQIGLHAYVATHQDILMAALTMSKEIIMHFYALTDDPITNHDIDDFVEFIVGEASHG